MIALTHDRRSSVIASTFRGSNQWQRELKLLTARRDGTLVFKSSQWKGAKPQLGVESHGKCAYCDAPASAVAHCDVEHYRPKSVYWWLALCYDNYLYACQICNQIYKGDRFPHAGPALTGPVVSSCSDVQLQALVRTFAPDPLDQAGLPVHLAHWASELALGVNPYLTDPEPLFAYVSIPDLKEVVVVPNPGASSSDRRVAQESIDLYGLDREELRRQRYLTYEVLEAAHLGLQQQPSNAHLQTILRLHVADSFAFSGMCRYFVRQVWGYTL